MVESITLCANSLDSWRTIVTEDGLRDSNRTISEVSVECAISAFHAEVKLGPDFVCTCCHRMMCVIVCNTQRLMPM